MPIMGFIEILSVQMHCTTSTAIAVSEASGENVEMSSKLHSHCENWNDYHSWIAALSNQQESFRRLDLPGAFRQQSVRSDREKVQQHRISILSEHEGAAFLHR